MLPLQANIKRTCNK